MMAIPTMKGLIFTSRNMVGLCNRLLEEMSKLALGTFTQDVLEAFFGNLVRYLTLFAVRAMSRIMIAETNG